MIIILAELPLQRRRRKCGYRVLTFSLFSIYLYDAILMENVVLKEGTRFMGRDYYQDENGVGSKAVRSTSMVRLFV